MRLTPHMRAALTDAQRPEGLRRVHHPDTPGADPWPAPPQTLRALERHGLVTVTETRNRKAQPVTVWRVTDAGRAALDPPAVSIVDRPVYLARPSKGQGDYTTNPLRRIDDLEVMHPSREWWRRSGVDHAEAVDRRDRARRTRAA